MTYGTGCRRVKISDNLVTVTKRVDEVGYRRFCQKIGSNGETQFIETLRERSIYI